MVRGVMLFSDIFRQYNWLEVERSFAAATKRDVESALAAAGHCSLEQFVALLSPAAEPYLESMAQLSHTLTRKRFGDTMQLYIPMYLSNECQNICTYCGFSLDNKIARTTLSDRQIEKEIRVIKQMGFDHVLLLSGEANKLVGVDYFERAIKLCRPHFSNISLEVQPLKQCEYERLRKAGLHAVLVYQETYHPELYRKYHPKGKKANFEYRLETADRLGAAGIHKIGIGSLLGLADWRSDAFFVALHLDYLRRTYWRTKFSVSFPRLRPAEGVDNGDLLISDRSLVQLICAYRLYDENLELSLSTRESSQFRDSLVELGITSVSAGSCTNPGGYAARLDSLEQFEIDDRRSPAQISEMLRSKGLEPVWKDWDAYL